MEIDPAYERFWGEPLDLGNSAGSKQQITYPLVCEAFCPHGVMAMPSLGAMWGSVIAAAMVHSADLPDKVAQIGTRQMRSGDA